MRMECSSLTGLGLMEWGCPAECDQKRTPVVQGCEGRSLGMSLEEESRDGVQPHYTSLFGHTWWDKLLKVTWLLYLCPFSMSCVYWSSGKPHRLTTSAACGLSCVSFRSTQSMDPPLAFQDPARAWWVLNQKSCNSSLACFVICQSPCLMFCGEAQAGWRCQSPACYRTAIHPRMLKISSSWIKGDSLFGFTAATTHLFIVKLELIILLWTTQFFCIAFRKIHENPEVMVHPDLPSLFMVWREIWEFLQHFLLVLRVVADNDLHLQRKQHLIKIILFLSASWKKCCWFCEEWAEKVPEDFISITLGSFGESWHRWWGEREQWGGSEDHPGLLEENEAGWAVNPSAEQYVFVKDQNILPCKGPHIFNPWVPDGILVLVLIRGLISASWTYTWW